MLKHVFVLVFIKLMIPVVLGFCSRSTSRLVRNVFIKDLEPVISNLELAVPYSCPLSSARDIYARQEHHKSSDSPGKWTCGFCGKSFYDEKYLDRHFEVRHPDHLAQGDDVTCLADYCDIFRCDVISGRVKPHFWDIALCNEANMKKLNDKCQNLLNQCIPRKVTDEQRTLIHASMNKTLCSYLTCELFWVTPDDELPRLRTVLYIIAGVFTLFGTFIYYFIAYTHFFSDESLLDGSRRPGRRRISSYRATSTSDDWIRRRPVNYQGQ